MEHDQVPIVDDTNLTPKHRDMWSGFAKDNGATTYCRLHRLLTQTNAVTVWEMLRDGSDIEALTVDVPQEFKAWLDGVESRLRSEFSKLENQALSAMLRYEGEKIIATPEQRKEFAFYAVKQQPVTPVLFAMLDGKDHAPIIWKMVRPSGAKSFKVDEE